eukprot:TRINITY_DN6301_c0_g1_i1.p1 TRINITY_DN6301_c0_g1~~TRINITY_DN6301_c0_g1_i1.p1  ORF type:complete len:385 (-),score=55.69 TRINITY_DN6301_c0_g1_i1:202-1356(-)
MEHGEHHGDESAPFIRMISAMVRVGGGPQSLREVGMFQEQHPTGLVIEAELELTPEAAAARGRGKGQGQGQGKGQGPKGASRANRAANPSKRTNLSKSTRVEQEKLMNQEGIGSGSERGELMKQCSADPGVEKKQERKQVIEEPEVQHGIEKEKIGHVIEMEGDLLECAEQFIVHQTNCVTKRAMGLAKSLFQKYRHADCYRSRTKDDVPGTIRIDSAGNDRAVIGLMGQFHPGKPKPAGMRDSVADRERWFATGLELIGQISELESVAFPDHIGCGLAGGSWDRYRQMLEQFARTVPHVQVVLYTLPSCQNNNNSMSSQSTQIHMKPPEVTSPRQSVQGNKSQMEEQGARAEQMNGRTQHPMIRTTKSTSRSRHRSRDVKRLQ